MKNNSGQSLVEVVLSIGVVVLVITGVVILMVQTIGAKTNSFDRKKASILADTVLEDLLREKNENPIKFWKLENIEIGKTLSGFNGFTYGVGYSSADNCDIDLKCTYVTVDINWGNSKALTVSKFFSD